jgi:hypothetical protein
VFEERIQVMSRRVLALTAIVGGAALLGAACGGPNNPLEPPVFAVLNVYGVVLSGTGSPVANARVVGESYFDRACQGASSAGFTVSELSDAGTGAYGGLAGLGPISASDVPVEGCIKLYAFPEAGSTLGADSIMLDSLLLDALDPFLADTVEVNFTLR